MCDACMHIRMNMYVCVCVLDCGDCFTLVVWLLYEPTLDGVFLHTMLRMCAL